MYKASCPICRENMYFKGMFQFKKRLETSKKRIVIQTVFEKYLEYILKNETKFSLLYIKFISEQLYKINTYNYIFNENEIDILLCYDIEEYKPLKSNYNVNTKLFSSKYSFLRRRYKFNKYKNILFIR
jgi:hypothetical protein